MGQLLLILTAALVVGVIVFGVAVVVTGGDPGLEPAEPDDRAVPLPTNRPLVETDVSSARFDVALRGYRMAQVDQALARAAYDIGYKDELINVLESEIDALRAGRFEDAEVLRRAREASLAGIAAGRAGRDAAGREAGGGVPAGHEVVDLGLLTPPAGGEAVVDNVAADEEPSAGEPPAEGSVADEPVGPEPAPAELTAGELAPAEPAAPEPAGGEPVAGEPVAGELVSEAPASGAEIAAEQASAEDGTVAGDPQPGTVDDTVPSRR